MVVGSNPSLASHKQLPGSVYSIGPKNNTQNLEALDKSSIQGWEKVVDCLNFDSQARLVETNKFLEFSPDLFDLNFFITVNDYTIINKFQGNEFVNLNMNFLLDGLINIGSIATLNNELQCSLYNLSDYLVNTLCKSVFIENDFDYIKKFSPFFSYKADMAIGELQVQYDEDAFKAPIVQDIATPDSKLYYPEPFIASPSFTHEEIWFIHILHYNYWLWFFFISLIMFYFITFINVVRWCNLRAKPKRETRGVSRSKCADLITACVPVSWAISIIISETVDATDYYDGFGTGEIVIGIRAYQWGWEYFYPKNIDLNYNVKPSYSTFIGNSIKYNNTTSNNLDLNVLWKYYQKKNNTAQLNSPAHLLLSPNDKLNSLNIIDFSNVGNSVAKDSNAFKKIQKFSKITTNNITQEITNDSQVFTKINNLYNDLFTVNNSSYSYGSDRQHNHASLDSFLPSFTTMVDSKGLSKFCDYSLNTKRNYFFEKSLTKLLSFTNLYNSNFERKSGVDGSNALVVQGLLLESSKNNNYLDSFFLKWIECFYNNYNYNNVSDAKIKVNPLKMVVKTDNLTKKLLKPLSTSKNMTADIDFSGKNTNFYTWTLFNDSKSYRFKDVTSSNLSFLTSEKNARLFLKKKNWRSNRDLTSETSLGLLQNEKLLPTNDLFLDYKSSKTKWLNQKVLKSLSSVKLVAPSEIRSPIMSSNIFLKGQSLDRVPKYFESDVPNMLSIKESSDYPNLPNTYWMTFWKNISLKHNYDLLVNNNSFLKLSYLPSVLEYIEYDFANWQAVESLEDSMWESTHSAFNHDEYINIKKNSLESQFYSKVQTKYNFLNRYDEESKYRFKKLYAVRPFLNTNFYGNKNDNLVISEENPLLPYSSTKPLSWYFFVNVDAEKNIENSYESLKTIQNIYFNDSQTLNFSKLNYTSTLPYTTVLDSFRAGYDENLWDFDSEQSLTSMIGFNNYTNSKTSNNIKLRSTAKNSIVTFNAIQKVYKSRFDDLRSNINFDDFTNSFTKYPFITENKSPYETMLLKNSSSFFNINYYKSFFKNNTSLLSELSKPNNIIFLDIPFLLSLKSDAARYMWFDWHARWSTIEVQPSSISRYSLAGLPYFSKKFEYSTNLSEELVDSENYLTKVSRARKNYMPNWAYSMYFYAKASNWFSDKIEGSISGDFNTTTSKILLKNARKYWKSYEIYNNNTKKTNLSNSALNRPNVVTWSPIRDLSSHYYSTSILIDILSKREYLYRQYLNNKLGLSSLPKPFTVSPRNTLLKEIQASYLFIDPTTYSSEATREFLYKNTSFLHYLFIKDFLKVTNTVFMHLNINFDTLSNYFVQLLGYKYDYKNLSKNLSLYKSQYRPMKKSVVNMIRLQATNAVAMPTEIRLHLLASSKDVIHSWAIPSAGIKIDCVPGYSSHRVSIFLTHGIFWGQCMEICGRYHHWMPIVVYFMKRDLFFLWCTHFMHYSDLDQTFNMNDKQLTDYLRLVSFDKTSWVDEINKSFGL